MNDQRDDQAEIAELSETLDQERRDLAACENELQCIYQVASTLSDPQMLLDDKLKHVVELVSSPGRHAKIDCARILVEGRAFETPRFCQTPWRQFSEIVAEGAPIGLVEAFYLDEEGRGGKGPFHACEQRLLDAVARAVGEHVRRAKVEHRIGERIKELNCLYEVSEMTHRESLSIDDVFRWIVERIPPAWQYPEIARARATLEGKTFVTEHFRETPWRQAQDIVVDGEKIGEVEVFYIEARPPSDEGPFLTEERQLLKVLAERLGDLVLRRRAEEAQIQKSAEIEAYNLELQQRLQVIKEQNELISHQRDIIQELSTPVLEVWQDVLTLPIIGVVDTRRATEIMSRLLAAIVERRAKFIILDVTGVDVVDTQIANHFIQIVEAARLLGASCMLTGIRPAVAQTLAELGVDLSEMSTHRDLREGLRECIQSMGYEMRRR